MSVHAPLPLIAENIPLALQQGKRFTAWRSEERRGDPKPAKMPYSPEAPKGASSTSPADWVTFERAQKYAQVAMLDGITRAFVHEDRMVGIDLDHCRNPETGEITPEAAERIKRLDTYTEISPSGTGVKMWVYGTMPSFGHKKGDVEIYGSQVGKTGPCGRFFTMTGHWLPGTPSTVGYRPDAVLALHREVFGDAPNLTVTERNGDVPALQIGDEEVLRLASESAHNGEKFRRLWSGDTSGYAVDGNDGDSEADAALCETLAYYGGPDAERIERLWLRSGLVRDKTERADYRQRTIAFALKGKTRFYGDSIQAAPQIGTDGASGCTCPACPSRGRVTYLERRLLDSDDLVEAQRAIITRHQTTIERQTRRNYAEYRVGKAKNLTMPQRAVVGAIAKLAASRAEYFGTDAAIITAEQIATEIGMSTDTAGAAAALVCGLPGSPVERVTEYRTDGKRGQLTTYRPLSLDPVELLEKFVVVAENVEAKKPSRPQPPKCKQHPHAEVLIWKRHVCGVCRKTLASTFPGEDALSPQVAVIAQDATEPVSVGNYLPQLAVIAERSDSEDDTPSVSVQVAAIGQEADPPVTETPVSLFDYAAERAKPWRCHCGCMERYPRGAGSWRCDGCGDVVLPAVSGGAE